MAATGSLAEYGVKHMSIAELLTDNEEDAFPTYDAPIDVPGVQTISYQQNQTSETLTGDDSILAIQAALESIQIDVEHGKLSHAVKAVLEGGTHSKESSVSGKSSSIFTLKGSSEAKYFRIDAYLTKTDKPGTVIQVTFYKVKVTSSSGERSYGAFKTNSFSCEAVKCNAGDELIMQEIEIEGGQTDGSLMEFPQIESVSPADGATGVTLASNVVVTFDRDMDADFATTAFFSLYDVTGSASKACAVTASASDAFTLNPSTDFTASHVYRLTVSGAVRDANGNLLGQTVTTTFTTAAS